MNIMRVQSNPLFAQVLDGTLSIEKLNSSPLELLHLDMVDFSIETEKKRKTLKKIALHSAQLIVFPWGLYASAKWSLRKIALMIAYPAQSSFLRLCHRSQLRKRNLQFIRSGLKDEPNLIVRHVHLNWNGRTISALLLGKHSTILNRKWIVQSIGNAEAVEEWAGKNESGRHYLDTDYNVLLVNSPNIGESGSSSTLKRIGENYAAGVHFLKTVFKANRLVLAGYSFGGAVLSLAQPYIDFSDRQTNEVFYLVVRQMTFGKIENVVKGRLKEWPILKNIIQKLTRRLLPIDNLPSSKYFSSLAIPEVIIQGKLDQMIPKDISLYHDIKEEKPALPHKTFHELWTDHHDCRRVLEQTIHDILQWDRSLNEATSLQSPQFFNQPSKQPLTLSHPLRETNLALSLPLQSPAPFLELPTQV